MTFHPLKDTRASPAIMKLTGRGVRFVAANLMINAPGPGWVLLWGDPLRVNGGRPGRPVGAGWDTCDC